ncbi:MAG: hypothetical protein ABSG42_07715 [Nitrospirota bacterium]
MKKWIKPLLAIVACVVIGGACFYWGYKVGHYNGYYDGFGYGLFVNDKVSISRNILFLRNLRETDTPEHKIHKVEEQIENELELDVTGFPSLDNKYGPFGSGVFCYNAARYIREHPFKREKDPKFQKMINDFLDKYDPQGKKN